MSHSLPSPSARGGNENIGQFLHERCLLLRSQHQIPVTVISEASVAKILLPIRKSALPMCELSSATSRLRAIRRKSFASIYSPLRIRFQHPPPRVRALNLAQMRQPTKWLDVRIGGRWIRTDDC